ncbi:Sensor protein CutS [Streptomyces davaonensis JCM 4913]|uniref:histidine kinase n=1 Tax=Streptomyces davaonensis (strain DSM 101723 / JCM 4913 / KCC S-0913 / 768) TaxID=1214101 RepID=K4R1C5_STRDJ|nr:HAMP domain-containing sensor histidine kinase [Streptomyces davaonensis]CCK26464.1 Sensor protein CutS [Streptomyces davaonensis JCM 4913]
MSRPRRISLRARLTLTYGGLFLVGGVVLLGVTYALLGQQLGGASTKVVSRTHPTGDPTPSSSDAPRSPSDAPQEEARTVVGGGPGLTTPPPGVDLDQWMEKQRDHWRDEATTSLLTQGGIALGVAGCAAAGLGWLLAGRVLAPLHRVTDTARRIAGAPAADRGLHERIALRGPDDEVKDLADTFDTMVERLDRSFDGQRRFVANASHELRTPLTLGRALVEMAMHRPTASADVQQLGENLLEINARHERLISGLLLLARSEHEIAERLPVDLADVVAHVVDQGAAEADLAGTAVHDESAEATTLGDALLLERLVHNLVENGVRHNSGDGGWVRVVTRAPDAERVELEVSNTGPPVPPYEVPFLFEPFRRLGADRVVTGKGAGLGLSIVRAIAHAHHGEVSAVPREVGGLTVTVTLPRDTSIAGDTSITADQSPNRLGSVANSLK